MVAAGALRWATSRRFIIVLALLAAGVLLGCATQRSKDTSAPNIAKSKIVITSVTSEPNLGNNGRISGEVVDEQQQPVIGATIKIFGTREQLVSTVATDIDGKFKTFPLPPGAYAILAEAIGFYSTKDETVIIAANLNTQMECKLIAVPGLVMRDDFLAPTVYLKSTTTVAVISQGANGQVYVDPH